MRKGERTRREIVVRALDLSGDLGLEGVTLGLLAADMQLSKSGLFAHFGSKESLQLEIIREAMERFTVQVIHPALARPRGEPRVTALFENYLDWIEGRTCRGMCVLVAFAYEFDDRAGPVRDFVVQSLRDWNGFLRRATSLAVTETHFRDALDTAQFAFEFMGIALSFQKSLKIFGDPLARARAGQAFNELLSRSRRDNGI